MSRQKGVSIAAAAIALAVVFFGALLAQAKQYFPVSETLLNGTLTVSGSTTDMAADDSVFRAIRGYVLTFGADSQSASATSQTTFSTNTTYQDKATLTWSVPTADKYLIYAVSEIQRTSTNTARNTKAQMTIDGTSYGESFDGHSTAVSGYVTSQQMKILSLTAASHTVKTQYATTNTANTATIKNSRIAAFRVGNNVQTTEPAGSATTSTSYVDIATLTFTPDIATDWIVLGHAEMINATAANQSDADFQVDGTTVGEHIQTQDVSTDYLPVSFVKDVSLTANASHTFKIRMKSPSGTTLTYRDVSLYAIPATLFSEVKQTVAETETTCTTCTTAAPTTQATLTFTPASLGTYLILAQGSLNTQSTSVYAGARLTIDGTTYDEDVMQGGSTAAYPTFAMMAMPSLTAASHTIKTQLFVQTTGTTVKMKGVRLLALRLPTGSMQKAEAEYSGTTDSLDWTQLNWTADAAMSLPSASVTYQLYDWQTASYPASGNGYISYTSSATANTRETQSQTISASPQDFRNTDGSWKMKVTASATSTSWLDWKGDFFKFDPSGTLSTDIVSSTGTPVASPSVAFPATSAGFSCQSATGTLGTSSQKLRVVNPSDNAGWTLSIAASSPTSLWSAGTPTYDFNDGSGSPAGCSDGADADTKAGRMTLDPSVGTVAVTGTGCSTTGISKGSSSAFAQGTNDSVSLLTASGSADLACIWDLTGVTAVQTIPADQGAGSYTINLTVSIVAS